MVTPLILNLILQLHCSSLDQVELHSQTPRLEQSTSNGTTSSTLDQSHCASTAAPEQSTSEQSRQMDQSVSAPGLGESEPGSKVLSGSTQNEGNQNDRNNATPQKYVGNSFSLKFHKPSCPFARVMRKSRRVAFPYRKAAVDAGQRPCKYCLPPWWLSVEAKILNYDWQTQSTREASHQDK